MRVLKIAHDFCAVRAVEQCIEDFDEELADPRFGFRLFVVFEARMAQIRITMRLQTNILDRRRGCDEEKQRIS